MWRLLGLFAIASCLSLPRPAAAQTRAPGEADPGVRPTRLIDRAEIRVSRVEIHPGATRSVHTHDDVEYQVWVPLEGTLQITVGSDPPVAANPGQAFFLKRGTPHGFKNVGPSAAAVMEIFVKQTTAARGQDAAAVVAELAQAISIRRR